MNKSNIIKNNLNINEYRLNFTKDNPVFKKCSADLSKKIKSEIDTNSNTKINNIQNIKIKNISTLKINNPIEKKENENCCNDVMIVDDEQFNVSCLSNNLKKLNILCDSCSDGIECLDLINKRLEKKCNCSKKNNKLILMDLIMPKMNGIEAVKNIQEMVNQNKIDDKYLNVVFISANVDQKDSLIDIQKKYPVVKGFLTKPVKITKIKDMLKRFYYE
jgi:CheY-like chemotaxis protein